MFQLDAYILGFEHLKALYAKDEDFGSCLLSVQSTLKVISWSKKVFYLRVHGCVYQGVARESFLLEKYIEVH